MKKDTETNQSYQSEIIRNTLRRFPTSSQRGLARYLVATHGGMFQTYNQARQALRWHSGKRTGGDNRRVANPVKHEPYSLMPRQEQIKREPYILRKGLWGIVPDLHVPYHEEKPLTKTLEWFKDSKVTGIIFVGDFQDNESIGFWRPSRRRNFLNEVEKTCDMLDMFRREFPKQKIIWQQGNHEDRLAAYYRHYAPELADLPTADMETILSLRKRKIELLEPKQKIKLHNFAILHGHELRGTYTPVGPARWAFMKMKACGAVAHFHTPDQYAKKDIQGRLIATWAFGCLCDLEPDYNPYGNDWSWGCAIMDYTDGRNWEMHNRRITPTGRIVP